METTDTSLVRVSPEQASLDNVNRVSELIARGGRLSDEDQSVIAEVLTDHKQHIQAVRVAVARHRAQRLFSLSSFVRLVEDELMRLDLTTMEPGQKIRLYSLLRNAMMEDLDFLEKVEGTLVVPSERDRNQENHLHLHVHGKDGEVTPDGREKIRTLFSRLDKALEKTTAESHASNGR